MPARGGHHHQRAGLSKVTAQGASAAMRCAGRGGGHREAQATAAGLDARTFSGHSLRAAWPGQCESRQDIIPISKHGRWAGGSAISRYVRDGEQFSSRNAVAGSGCRPWTQKSKCRPATFGSHVAADELSRMAERPLRHVRRHFREKPPPRNRSLPPHGVSARIPVQAATPRKANPALAGGSSIGDGRRLSFAKTFTSIGASAAKRSPQFGSCTSGERPPAGSPKPPHTLPAADLIRHEHFNVLSGKPKPPHPAARGGS